MILGKVEPAYKSEYTMTKPMAAFPPFFCDEENSPTCPRIDLLKMAR